MITIHSTADVQSKNIGENTNVWQYCVALPNAKIGKNCNICSRCFIENNVIIGDNVTIKCGVQIWDGMRIEDNVLIGANAIFCNDKYPKSKNKNFILEPVIIKKGASIGANATILAGITIGENSTVGGQLLRVIFQKIQWFIHNLKLLLKQQQNNYFSFIFILSTYVLSALFVLYNAGR